jgi:hypothetical protein
MTTRQHTHWLSRWPTRWVSHRHTRWHTRSGEALHTPHEEQKPYTKTKLLEPRSSNTHRGDAP